MRAACARAPAPHASPTPQLPRLPARTHTSPGISHALLSTRQEAKAFNQRPWFDLSSAEDMGFMFTVRSAARICPASRTLQPRGSSAFAPLVLPRAARSPASVPRPPRTPRPAHIARTHGSMTTFLGVWHQSLGVTSKWLRGRRCVRGGDSRLHCTVLPVVPLAGGRGSGYVARPPRKRAKTRQKPRTAPRCSVVSPCTGRNRASLRRSSEPLQASQARATLRRPAAPEDQSRRPRRTRLLPQERPRAEEAEVDVKMTPLSAETVRGS